MRERECKTCFAYLTCCGCTALKKGHGYDGDCPFWKSKEELSLSQIETDCFNYGGKKNGNNGRI